MPLVIERRANFNQWEGQHRELLLVPFGVWGVNAVLAREFPWQQISRSSSRAAFEDARQQSVTRRKTEQRVWGRGKKKSRKSERGQGKLQIEEGKVMVIKHRSSGNWALRMQIPVDDRMAVLQSEIKIQIQHLPSLEAAGQHLRDWGLLEKKQRVIRKLKILETLNSMLQPLDFIFLLFCLKKIYLLLNCEEEAHSEAWEFACIISAHI